MHKCAYSEEVQLLGKTSSLVSGLQNKVSVVGDFSEYRSKEKSLADHGHEAFLTKDQKNRLGGPAPWSLSLIFESEPIMAEDKFNSANATAFAAGILRSFIVDNGQVKCKLLTWSNQEFTTWVTNGNQRALNDN